MPKTKTSGQGRKKGVPNKATVQARQAIAMFVDGNADRLQGWLDEIATEKGAEAAFKCFSELLEYHVPKLSRAVISGDPDNPVQHQHALTVALDFDAIRAARGEGG